MAGRVRRKTWIDITMPFGHPAGTFPGDARLEVEWTARLGDRGPLGVNLSRICSSPHNGTHSDAPYHVMEDGARSEALDVAAYLGPCLVIDATRGREPAVRARTADAAIRGRAERVLFKTRSGPVPDVFPSDFRGLGLDLAERLAAARVRLVGTDAPSVDRADVNGLRAHRALFRAGVTIIENLDLHAVKPGRYELVALPLKVSGLCAAPVRALLRGR